MKTTIFRSFLFLFVSFFFSGCQIYRAGVLEIKNTIKITIEENFYSAELVDDEDNNYTPGVEFNLKPTSPNYDTYTAIYWPDKSPKDLGYNYICDGETKKFKSQKECNGSIPGKNGHWAGDIDDEPIDENPPPSGTKTILLSQRVSGDVKSKLTYNVTVPTGTKSLNIILTEEFSYDRQTADLFVRKNTPAVINISPSYSWTADYASIKPNRETENCDVTNPSAGVWCITVYGYVSYFSCLLTVSITK